MARKKTTLFPSFQEYHRFLKSEKTELDAGKLSDILRLAELNESIIGMLPGAAYILNYQQQKYHFVSSGVKDLLGYAPNIFLEKGNQFYLTLMHPEDREVYSSQVFREFLSKTQQLEKSELLQTMFSINYRLKRKDGNYIHIFQQYKIADLTEDGYPLISVGYVSDISSIKQGNKIVFSASVNINGTKTKEIRSEVGASIKNNLSEREMEVIHYLMKGLSSKQIADKLGLSMFTVNAHRRNILSKTKCNNTAEIIYFAIENGIG